MNTGTAFDAVYPYEIGAGLMYIGKLRTDGTSAPQVYAAAYSAQELLGSRCGFGVSVDEAAVDLLRVTRGA